jgi:hypothetical protein
MGKRPEKSAEKLDLSPRETRCLSKRFFALRQARLPSFRHMIFVIYQQLVLICFFFVQGV